MFFKTLFNSVKATVTNVVTYPKQKWAQSLGFNFQYGTELALFQETVFALYKGGNPIPPTTITQLEHNAWVTLAAQIAPCNLVLRQWCLIDLIKNQAGHSDIISNMIDKISYKNPSKDSYRIWAEGYSYWQYVRIILDEWLSHFDNAKIKAFVAKIDQGFIQTSYVADGMLYPVLLGDLRHVPLDPPLQTSRSQIIIANKIIGNVEMTVMGNNIRYEITGRPLGFNLHVPKNDYTITVSNGVVTGWTWYEGYDKKYPNTTAEMADMLDIKRIMSI